MTNDNRLTLEDVARVCHEANRALCVALGDLSQPSWNSAPQWQTDSALKGVSFHRNNPDAPASASHESWMAEKERTGWVYGETKSEHALTHPCMVPFENLPQLQQAKDHLFRATCHALLPFVDKPQTSLLEDSPRG